MKKNIFTLLLLLTGTGFQLQAQQAREQAFVLKRMLEELHCCPRTLDNTFSAQVYNKFIQRLDPQHLFFTAADLRILSPYRESIDDELQGKSWEFLDKASFIYRQRLQQADSIIPLLLQKPFDYSLNEKLVMIPDSNDYAADPKTLRARWSLWLKYYTLDRLVETALADTVNTPAAAKSLAMKQEASVREKVKVIQQRRIKKVLAHASGYENYIASIFLNAITACYDPHSMYMPQTDKENFEGAVTGVSYSFGLELNENEQGEVVIEHLVPGGPAWRSGELNKDDVLIKMKWDNKQEIDLSAASVEETEALLSDLNHDRLELTVRKPGGIERSVTLAKEKIRSDESFVKSFVLSGEKKIGYIYLPGFYTEWGNENGSSCANDVAKEIVKLKQEKIDGLVLDLRNNGGGSIQEAIDMAGIFIEEGPLAFVKDKIGKPRSLKDMNRGTIYDGPMLVMVNGQSASASEMVAGALQDYNRAVITGSPSFGKATVQVILPADTMLLMPGAGTTGKNKKEERLPAGYVDLTIEKLYRVTGKSNQLNGVMPDVPLPDMLSKIDYRESSYRFALPADTVKRSPYYKPLQPLPVQDLAKNSAGRVNSMPQFAAVNELAEVLRELYDPGDHSVPLSWDKYAALIKQQNDKLVELQERMLGPAPDLFKAANNAFDAEGALADPYRAELNAKWLENIATDIYIQEAYRIITDLINMSK